MEGEEVFEKKKEKQREGAWLVEPTSDGVGERPSSPVSGAWLQPRAQIFVPKKKLGEIEASRQGEREGRERRRRRRKAGRRNPSRRPRSLPRPRPDPHHGASNSCREDEERRPASGAEVLAAGDHRRFSLRPTRPVQQASREPLPSPPPHPPCLCN